MKKFFVKENQINNNIVIINGDDVNHIKNVLRLNIGDEILVCNQDTSENFVCSISKISKMDIICSILEKKSDTVESNIKIDIYQGLPKADKMELIIQKGTELGVNNFIPVKFKRTVVKFNEKDILKK